MSNFSCSKSEADKTYPVIPIQVTKCIVPAASPFPTPTPTPTLTPTPTTTEPCECPQQASISELDTAAAQYMPWPGTTPTPSNTPTSNVKNNNTTLLNNTYTVYPIISNTPSATLPATPTMIVNKNEVFAVDITTTVFTEVRFYFSLKNKTIKLYQSTDGDLNLNPISVVWNYNINGIYNSSKNISWEIPWTLASSSQALNLTNFFNGKILKPVSKYIGLKQWSGELFFNTAPDIPLLGEISLQNVIIPQSVTNGELYIETLPSALNDYTAVICARNNSPGKISVNESWQFTVFIDKYAVPCTSHTPTPSITRTLTPTPTITPSPTTTVSLTPSPTVTPTFTQTPTSTMPDPTVIASLLIMGGGGGGGSAYAAEGGGGGGAGGVIEASNVVISYMPGRVYNITIGAGGAGSTQTAAGTNGGDTFITGMPLTTSRAIGGGVGGGTGYKPPGILFVGPGFSGGSGGGGSGFNGPKNGGAGTAGQGSTGNTGYWFRAGGGGGALSGPPSWPANDERFADGQVFTTHNLQGYTVNSGGGGGGGPTNATWRSMRRGVTGGSIAGQGDGGDDGVTGFGTPGAPTAGTDGVGGGGGGGLSVSGARGGCGGVVIVYDHPVGPVFTGGTITSVGTLRIHTFNVAGTFTLTS